MAGHFDPTAGDLSIHDISVPQNP